MVMLTASGETNSRANQQWSCSTALEQTNGYSFSIRASQQWSCPTALGQTNGYAYSIRANQWSCSTTLEQTNGYAYSIRTNQCSGKPTMVMSFITWANQWLCLQHPGQSMVMLYSTGAIIWVCITARMGSACLSERAKLRFQSRHSFSMLFSVQ